MTGVVLLRPAGGGGSGGTSDISLTTINGQLVPTFVDTTRANKVLSVSDTTLVFGENALSDQDWIRIGGNATDADSGIIADLDGTITLASGHCENTGANVKDINIFINGVDSGPIGTLSGGANVTFTNTTLDLDFNQGDRIRLRAVNGSGAAIQDTVIKLTMKWRG